MRRRKNHKPANNDIDYCNKASKDNAKVPRQKYPRKDNSFWHVNFSVKTGPFHEHSNQLWNISGVQLWTKVYTGMKFGIIK